jgi:hypothetical protein
LNVNDPNFQLSTLSGGFSTNTPPAGRRVEFGNFSIGWIAIGSPFMFGLPSRCTVFIQNIRRLMQYFLQLLLLLVLAMVVVVYYL